MFKGVKNKDKDKDKDKYNYIDVNRDDKEFNYYHF